MRAVTFVDEIASRAAGAAVWPRSSRTRLAATILGLAALMCAAPASAVTLDNGVVLITQADALAGGVTPGDAAGFPITLSVPGSYRFASNLQVSTFVDGISVAAPEVTIDMAGFRMAGGGVAKSAIVGVNQRALTVKNGAIRGFTANAIVAGSNMTVDRMRVADNPVPSNNISNIYGDDNLIVRKSVIARNGSSNAINCFNYCRVEYNIIVGTGAFIGGVNPQGIAAIILGNTISNYNIPLISNNALTVGDNTFVGNINGSQATLLPLDPNQPP